MQPPSVVYCDIIFWYTWKMLLNMPFSMSVLMQQREWNITRVLIFGASFSRCYSTHVTPRSVFARLSSLMSFLEEENLSDFVRERVVSCSTHAQISNELQAYYPGQRGLSEASVRRFCASHEITRRYNLSDEDVFKSVAVAVKEVHRDRSNNRTRPNLIKWLLCRLGLHTAVIRCTAI